MAFRLRGDKYQVETAHALLDGSLTVKVGDVIVPLATTNGVVTNATGSTAGSGCYILGVVTGFCKANGEVISTGTDPSNTPASLTTISTNQTVDKYHAQYIPVTPEMIFSADLSATAGTTTNSDGTFVWFNLSDCRTVGETTVLQYGNAAAPLQLWSLGVDPEGAGNKAIICRFALAALYRP